MRLPYVLLMVCVPLVSSAGAQAPHVSATITMNADRTRMEVGEIFRLTVEMRVQGASNVQVQLPDLGPFDIISRQVSTPYSLRFGFGNTQQVQSTTRHVLTLRSRQAGHIELAPAFVELSGRRFLSNALTFEIGGAPGDPSYRDLTPTQQLPPANHLDGMDFDPNGFVRTWVDEGEPYVGQQVTVTVYLYLAQNLHGSPTITREPSTDGFWVQDLLGPSHTMTARRQTLNGRRFQVYVLRRFAAFPLQEGELTIGATSLSIEQRGIFNLLGGRTQQPFQRTGVPLTITARPLPDGGPPGVPHVGSLELVSELDRTQIATGDAVTLTLTATGRGHLEQLGIPTPSVDGLRILAPEIRPVVSSPDGVVGGTRTIRWLIVPERPGSYSLGPFTVPVLDPRSGTWSVARARALTLVAAGNAITAVDDTADDPPAEPAGSGARSEVTFGPVHTSSALHRTHASLTEQPWFLGLLAIGPLAFLLALGGRTARRIAARDDPSKAPKRARRAARKRLVAARALADANEPRLFYAAITSALKEVLEAKLGHAVGSLTHPQICDLLVERGMDEELAAEIVEELEGCDFARFSAVGISADEMESCRSRTRELLGGIDRFNPTAPER